MRFVILLLPLFGLACAAREPRVVTADGATSLDAMLRARPIAADANVRADEIARTSTSSVHIVQIRGGETPHRHAAHDLAVTLVRGEGTLTIAGRRVAMTTGDVVVVPRGVPHWFVRGGRDVAVSVAVFTPPLDAPDTVPEPTGVDSPPTAR